MAFVVITTTVELPETSTELLTAVPDVIVPHLLDGLADADAAVGSPDPLTYSIAVRIDAGIAGTITRT